MALGLLAVVLALVVGAALLPPPRALGVLVVTLVLVPGSLPLPGAPGLFTIHRVVALVALLGLLRRCALRQVPWTVLRPAAVGWRFLLALAVLGALGVGLLQATTDPGSAVRSWEAFASQVVFFSAVLALARASAQDLPGALPLVLAVVGSAVIAAGEHLTGQSYDRLWYHLVPSLLSSDNAQVLAVRGGNVRVRAAADFTLAFAWSTAACLPLVLVLVTRYRGLLRRVLLTSLPLLLLAVVWTYSRSVAAPAALGVLLVAAFSRDRALGVLTLAGTGIGGLLVLNSPSIQRDFSVAVDQGSIDVRVERLPAVAELAAAHPFRGIGLSGLASLGIPTTDSTYLLLYAEVGAIGVAVVGALLLLGLAASGRGLLSRSHDERIVALALALGTLLLIVGAVSFDAFTTPSVAELFWTLVAFGIVLAERSSSLLPVPRITWRARVLAVLALVGVGFVLRASAPSHVAQEWQFETLDATVNTLGAPTFTGVELRTTACSILTAEFDRRHGVATTCAPSGDAPGQTLLRLQAPSRQSLSLVSGQALFLIHKIPTLERTRLVGRGPAVQGIPSGLRTAPASLLAFGLLLTLPVPIRRRTG